MNRAEISEGPSMAPQRAPVPKRKPFSRLSFGHILMIATGLLALLLNVALLRSSDDTVSVVVAANSISAGNRLLAADVTTAEIDADSPFRQRVLTRAAIEPLLGHIVIRDIVAGAPLLSDDLRRAAAPGAGRAMSLPIPPSRAVAADLHRGDRVDVISVSDGIPAFIATGLEVLAVADPGDGRFANAGDFSVTLAVDDLKALAIAGALENGEVHVIRSTGAQEPNVPATDPAGTP